MITIDNMSPHQRQMLDCIWDCDSHDELMLYISTLDKAEQRDAHALVQLLVAENVDMEQQAAGSYRLARDVLTNIMAKQDD